MAKPQIASPDEPEVEVNVNVNPTPTGEELQGALDQQRRESDAIEAAFAGTATPAEEPQQPYMLESAAWKADLQAKHSSVSAEIAKLEATRNGLNARIDDLNALRNSVKAGMDVLK